MPRDVIVVGAGPVGLMLAGELTLGGADVVVYERLAAPARESRGASLTKRTAECFDQRGLLGGLGPTEPADAHFGGVPIDLAPLAEDHHGRRGVPQFRTERMLEEWVTGLGAEIRRGQEVTAFEETDEAVRVLAAGPDGPAEESAAYLVGCDGGRSSVRKLAGIGFPGSEGRRGFLSADVTGIETRKRRIGENLPGGSMIMAMDLENGVTRIVVHEAGMAPHDRASLTYTDLADAWQRLTGESLHHGECRWLGCFTDASRSAAVYRRGRVLLAGDSAHIQPPAMAQGLSVGVQDAVNLGWKLAATVRGWAPEGLLDTYDAERRPVGEQLARNARAAIELRLTGEDMDPVREIMGELVRHEGPAGHLAGMVSNLGVRYELGKGEHPLLGLRMPPGRELTLTDGTVTPVAGLLRTGHGLLITTDPALARLAEGLEDRLDIVTGTWNQAYEPGLDAVLIRPDGYVAWTSPGTTDELTGTLARWFGTAQRS
ncbi:2-polyprenyl-6-methoxyphenol hydroxylase-like FAD-dependent oxidoreductase [Streptomyces brevispora]|uniref:2-polyprenyl-6-methoxyphenol hydroxylase-like FAD-dependent oxidoreductase n=1 Tax=Streptomyces brevispora TaxID=887462 RepID=A0A561TYG8_9ACTN|nr:FAD-dependent monooxygenase [Streptomyces brevispora]TWF92128.1 2-polyprenyl-6-methoxyphenol hydroxylase-like FAD-dependent oxidoreductase [Streptomyces brevispora]